MASPVNNAMNCSERVTPANDTGTIFASTITANHRLVFPAAVTANAGSSTCHNTVRRFFAFFSFVLLNYLIDNEYLILHPYSKFGWTDPMKTQKLSYPRNTARGHHTSRPGSTPRAKQLQPFPIVAIGASAGGIKALTELLTHLNPELGMAYVLVTHLSPNHKSALAEVLQSKTGIKVQTVTNGMTVMRNVMYVSPPRTLITPVGRHLELTPISKDVVGNFSIDHFFTALAGVHKNNTIGIILSGTGTDGTLGLKAVKTEGGITFAQDASAEFNGMPGHAYNSGYVDFRLSPGEIARELERFAQIPYLVQPSDKIEKIKPTEIAAHDTELQKILAVVKAEKGIDFYCHYKHASIFRRILRRMALNKCATVHDYLLMIETDVKEVNDLYDDFLINVTDFFRDPDFYSTLVNRIFPSITKERHGEPIRIWVAGCSTGEEAYSIAIFLTEFMKDHGLNIPVNIFASDLDGRAIEKARVGNYPISALRSVPPAYIEKYFVLNDNHYHVVRAIRQLCVFSKQNLLQDPPFARMDLISCQNVLIYLATQQHERVLRTFHYALQPRGFLFLGKSESTGTTTDLFESLDKRIKVYSRKSTKTLLDFTSDGTRKAKPVERNLEVNGDRILGNRMLSQFVYPCVVVNKEFIITEFFGITSPYLGPRIGKASLNILKIIRDDLVIDVGSLLHKAKATDKAFSKSGILLKDKKIMSRITLEVVPQQINGETFFLVVFRPETIVTELSNGRQLKTKGAGDRKKIAQLEVELSESRGLVRATNEEYETTYEELQANNEEILSSNEELQSVNEELEASKEELQAALDRLTSTNLELKDRNGELAKSQKDLQKVNSQLEQFAVISSHDLQEPLRKISILSQRLLNGQNGINEEGKSVARNLSTSAIRMSALISDLLSFSLLGASAKLWVEVDLNQVISALIEDFDTTIESKRMTVTVGDLPNVIGEPFHIHQLLHHLLDNVLKYTAHDTQLIISSHEVNDADYLKYSELNAQLKYNGVEFSANSILLDKKHPQKIFEFLQLFRNAGDPDGIGVSLSLCRKIAEAHGGHLYGHGVKAVGATFTTFFPVR